VTLHSRYYLTVVLMFLPRTAIPPELPEVDRVEMISKSEVKVTLRQCDEWSRRHERHKVRATMSDRGSDRIWSNSCVFSPKVSPSLDKGGSRVLANN
jgi:hypothetical protein